eukprot:11692417-Alexandrium_andersonii.AAC.1
MQAYGRLTLERIEVSANLLEKDTYLDDSDLSVEMARDFLCTLMQLIRRNTERRGKEQELP